MSWQAHDTAASHYVRSTDEPGLNIHVRVRGDGGGPPVLFVHGATYASRLYDIPHPGASWLEATASAGFTAYALDVRGYGLSRSSVMEEATEPYAPAADAIRDIDDVAHWICARHGTGQVSLVGGSWGSITSALYATTIGRDRVGRLLLSAPIYGERNEAWLRLLGDPNCPDRLSPDWQACRWVDEDGTRARWDDEIPEGLIEARRDEGVFQALVRSSLADDPLSGDQEPAAFRAPNGTFLDLWEAFNERPVYDPRLLACPLLLMRGGEDPTSTRSDALALFDRAASQQRSYVEIANAGHFLSAERNAPQAFAIANGFLAG